MSEKATSPIVLATPADGYRCSPKVMRRLMATDMNTPAKPTVISTAGDMIEAARGRGTRFIRPGVSLSRPSAMPTGAVITKLIHSTWLAEKG